MAQAGLRAAAGQPRRELTRPARLRWLAGGRYEADKWEAFLAPAGRSLPDIIANDGSLPWPEVRPILEQLAAELTTAADDGTLPASLSVDQIRVQSSGKVQLLDWPLRDTDKAALGDGCELPLPQQSLALVSQTAVLALEGQPWRPHDSRGRTHFCHKPLPEHADGLLTRLLDSQKPHRDVQEFERELAATRDRPAEVTRARCAAHLAVFTVLVAVAVGECMLPAGAVPGFVTVTILSTELEKAKQALQDLEEGAWSEFTVSAVNPDPTLRLHGLAQLDADLHLRDQLQTLIERRQREREARLEALNSLIAEFLRWWAENKRNKNPRRARPCVKVP